ncbi:MAG: hypothetical protein ABI821_09170 [Pseudomonadota bacterium]
MNDLSAIGAIPSALQSATGAINKSLRAVEKDANVVARSSGVDARETVGALVDSRQQVLYTQAAAKIVKASDEMVQSLLDIRA